MTIEGTEEERDWWWAALFMACGGYLMVFGLGAAVVWTIQGLSYLICCLLGECP